MISMNSSSGSQMVKDQRKCVNQNIQVYVRQRPLNSRERNIRSLEVVNVISPREIETRHTVDSKITKKFTFDRVFGPNSRQVEVYSTVVAPLIDEVLAGYNCTVFAYGQTGTGKTHTMVGTACPNWTSSWDYDSEVGIIPRAFSHLFDELRLKEVDFSMRISYLELYNEELCDLLSTDDSVRVRIFDDATKKGSVIIQGLEEIPVHNKDDVYKLLEKGQERRKTATTLMNAQSSRSHTVFSILVHIRETGIDGEEMLKIGKLNLVDLAGSENSNKAGTEKGLRVREAVNINQSLLTLGRVITALVEHTPHIPYRESKLTRLLQESLGGRTKTSIIATISPGHKDIEETLSTLQYADRAKSIQNKPEVNQKLTKVVMIKEYSEEIERLKRDLIAARDKNGIYLSEENFSEINSKMDGQQRELNEKVLLIKALKDEMLNKERHFNDLSENFIKTTKELQKTENILQETQHVLQQKEQTLKKTKKRYMEKKTLLDSHVRTEVELTKQASEILTVADVATNDAQQLHHSIERRQHVEKQIEKTCDQFTEQMNDHFEIFQNNLKQLQEEHANKFNIIKDDLSKDLKQQNELSSKVGTQVEQLQKILDDTDGKSAALAETANTTLKDLSENQRETFIDLLMKQKEIYIAQKRQIMETLAAIASNNKEQNSLASALLQTVQSSFQQFNLQLQNYTQTFTAAMAENLASARICIEQNAKLAQSTADDFKMLQEEKDILADFVQKMNMLSEKRTAKAEEKLKIKEALESGHASVAQSIEACQMEAEHFQTQQNDFKQKCQTSLEENLKQLQSFNEISAQNCASLQEQSENFVCGNVEAMEQLAQQQAQNCAKLQGLFAEQLTQAGEIRAASRISRNEAIDAAKAIVESGVHKTKNGLMRFGSYATDLQSAIATYAGSHAQQIASCASDVEKFRKVELKTYVPTGMTPSKREFVYPRVLATTSPHDKILKRLRQDNDCSDFDVTATIDEEELELPMGQSSLVNSLRETSNIVPSKNSTPVVKHESHSLSLSKSNKENLPQEL